MNKIVLCILLVISLSSANTEMDGYLDRLYAPYRVGANIVEPVTLTVDELVYIYKGVIKNWGDGTPIQVYVKPYKDYLQKTMLIDLLGMSASTFKENVARNKNIISISKRADMLQTLMTNIGSIGILSETDIVLSSDYGVIRIKIVESREGQSNEN